MMHHAPFACSDITALVQRSQQQSAQFPPIPDSHYDYLAAKWGLNDAELARLRRLHLSCYRDDSGELRRADAAGFADRFPFKIVERRGHRGVGATDAAFWMAARVRQRPKSGTL